MNWANTISRLLGICVTSALFACSSGGGESNSNPTPAPAATSAEGLWNGTTASGRTTGGLILDDGTYWFLYTGIANPNAVDSSLNGTYVMKQTLSGTIAHRVEQTTFSSTYDPDYELTLT